MNCRQCDPDAAAPLCSRVAEKSHCGPLRAEDQLLQREGTHFQKQLAFKNTV